MSGARAHYTEAEIEKIPTQELLLLYKSTGLEELRWPLVLRYTGLVKSIALQIRGVYSSFAQVDDIIQEGLLALVSALDKYDPEKETKFETYVSKRIRGSIIDLARRQDWVPRSVRRKVKEMDQASSELFSQLGRSPTDEEMAKKMGISQEKYQEELAQTALCNVLSLDTLFEEWEQGPLGIPDADEGDRPEESLLRQELLEALTQGIQSLRENEQMVLSLYYEKNLNMKEIAQVLNVSKPRISQIHTKAIQRLREYMQRYMEGKH